MKAPVTDKHLLELMWERFPEIMKRGTEQAAPVQPTEWAAAHGNYQGRGVISNAAMPAPVQKVGTIGHIGDGPTTLTAAVAPLLAEQPAQQEPLASKLLKQEEEINSLRNDLRRAHDAYCQLTREPAPVQQEFVAWMFQHEETGRTMCVDAQQVEWGFEKGNPRLKKIAPLYTSPPAQRTWVGLSDLDIDELENEYMKSAQTAHQFLRAIESKLRSKNI